MHREELAQLLRRARRRVAPEDVGIPHSGRRRVAGLRREEVATLAGISVDYVVRLEQGRGPHPSASVLRALARALRLNDLEQRELFELADVAPPRAGQVPMLVRSSVLRLIDRLHEQPVMVLSAKGDVLAWNALASALLGDWSRHPVRERNIIWQRFLGVGGRVALTPEEEEETAAQSVASLRAAATKYPGDAELKQLVGELRSRSERFDRLWADTPSAQWVSHSKTIQHPALGPITLDCDTLQLPDTDQAVIVYSAAPDSEAARQLTLLSVVGTQDLASH